MATSTTPPGLFGTYAGNAQAAPASAGISDKDLGKKKQAMSALSAIMRARGRGMGAGAGMGTGTNPDLANMLPGGGGYEYANFMDSLRMNPMNTFY